MISMPPGGLPIILLKFQILHIIYLLSTKHQTGKGGTADDMEMHPGKFNNKPLMPLFDRAGQMECKTKK